MVSSKTGRPFFFWYIHHWAQNASPSSCTLTVKIFGEDLSLHYPGQHMCSCCNTIASSFSLSVSGLL